MFTDMVGYTALGQRNESLSLALVDEQKKLIRPAISRHTGREVKTMGNAFLVEFPSALEAVRCAYDIQRAAREFNISLPDEKRVHLRIGIHVGDIIAVDVDISGDAVNVASRIEPLSEDGGVCISRQVFDHVQNKFEIPMTSIGTKSLRHVSTPIEIYSLALPWKEKGESIQSRDKRRVAVLPFSSMSPDPNDEYFADGITEELISTISRVRGLRVIARTSAMHYKGQGKRVSEIGSELRVGTVLEGSVWKSGERVRISAQLIDAPTEEHLWAEDYDRKIEDVFEIQKEIATRIAKELEVKLLPEEKEVIDRKDTGNSSAHTLYLKGRYFWSERSREGLLKAKDYFEKAIELDPAYARAYSGLSDTYSIMAFQSIVSSEEGQSKAKELAEMAVRLDNTLAEAHTSLAYVLPERNFSKWNEAENEYRLALTFNPSYATAHFWYSIQLLWHHRYDETIEQARQAEELDPLSPAISTALGQNLLYSRRIDEAIEHLEKRLLDIPDSGPAHFILGIAYFYKGDFAKAEAEERQALAISPVGHRTKTILGMSLFKLGKEKEAREILDNLEKSGAQLSLRALLLIELGETENAIECLTKAYRENETALGWINVVQTFDRVRTDSRFLEIIRGMNLPTD
jgi:adenylate cyclase